IARPSFQSEGAYPCILRPFEKAGSQMIATNSSELKSALKRSEVRARRRAFLLVLPLIAFILISFVIPILSMLHRSAHNPAFAENMPQLTAWFASNPEQYEPDETAYTALVSDLKA